MDEKQLLKCCLQGEVEEYEKIVNMYKGKAMTVALNMLRNREDAEDVCQEAFVQVYRNLNRFDFNANFKNWFYSILYRKCIDKIRKKSRLFKSLNKLKIETEKLSAVQTPDPSLAFPISHKFLKELSPKERITLILWAHEGYTSEEIASILRCSSSTVRVYLFKARKKVKSLSEKENVQV